MKMIHGKRLLCMVLAVIMLICLMPASVLAAPTNSFVLVVETADGLVIPPEYITYTEGQSIGEALVASGHTFDGIEDNIIHTIDGVTASYTRSDNTGEYDLYKEASEITHFRFSENVEGSQPGTGLMELMTAMADYLVEDKDVRTAAKAEYDEALEQFVGISDDSARVLAKSINDAIKEYKDSINGTAYAVSFSDGTKLYTSANYNGIKITAENAYGKQWVETKDGVLSLPKGEYTFKISCDGLSVSGDIEVSDSTKVTAALPDELWLKTDEFRLSGSYNSTGDSGETFEDDEFEVSTWTGRSTVAVVADTFTGTVYTNAKYDTELLSSVPEFTAIYRSAATGEVVEYALVFDSYTTGPTNVLSLGANGNAIIYRLSSKQDDGYTYSQDYTVKFERRPTLKSITVTDANGTDQAPTMPFDGNETEYTYKVLDTVASVTIGAEGLGDTYEVTVNGNKMTDGGIAVELDTDSSGNPAKTSVEVCVSAGEYSTVYTLSIQPGEGKNLNFRTANADITVEVVNSNGVIMPYKKFKESATTNIYQYVLVPGETYSYVATLDTYYHVKDEFKLEEVANSTITVSLAAEDWISALALGTSAASGKKGTIPLDTDFAADKHKYTVTMEDTESLVYLWATGETDADINAIYNQIHSSALYQGKEKTVAVTSGKNTGAYLQRVLLHDNPYGNEVTVRISKADGGMTYYQDYVLEFVRRFSLESLTATSGGSAATLMQEDGTAGYNTAVREYTVTVPLAAKSLELFPKVYERSSSGGWNTCYGEDTTGYKVSVDGVDVTEKAYAEIELDGTINTQTVTVKVTNEKVPGRSESYVISVLKSPPVYTTFELEPADALLSITEAISGERVWPEDGRYMLCENFNYSYTLTKYGYIGKSGIIEVTRNDSEELIVKIDDIEYTVNESDGGGAVTITQTLEIAPENEKINAEIDAQWPDFRGNSDNNAVTSAPTPTAAEDGTLYWANQIGEGYDSNAVGSPIIVDGDLITYAGNTIYRVDTISGEILATGTMDHKSSFAITPPTYYEGMVFVALSNGTVQAFNAETLESLWIYKDALGGQPNSPITVCSGYLYTGFWNQENQVGNFVCLSVTDEDPTQTMEEKCSTWYYTQLGGFYWAGAYASDDYVLVGTDDGYAGTKSQTGSLLMLEPKTGKLLDSWTGLNGDVRSSVSYDSATNAYYFTSKGGTFYSVKVSNGKLTDKWSVTLSGMSTSTPSVYNGRAYVGVSGVGQFSPYSGHNITVIDLNARSIAYTATTQGYPQTSGLVTTAYDGYTYVYFFDNMTPGKLRVLRDKAGQTKADYLTVEGDYTTAYALFTPTGEQAEYVICSPIVDDYGTIYFKNDSAHLMAYGSAIKKIEVTTLPAKMNYEEGEKFDPTGMVVTATYANGKTRDITEYVTYNEEALTEEDAKFTISFPYVMYHNRENGTAMESGIVSTTPTAVIDLTFGNSMLGDANGDGTVDSKDAQYILTCEAQNKIGDLNADVCDVSGDGKIDSNDAVLIAQFAKGKITEFPAAAADTEQN